jgi:hypothetical protein
VPSKLRINVIYAIPIPEAIPNHVVPLLLVVNVNISTPAAVRVGGVAKGQTTPVGQFNV